MDKWDYMKLKNFCTTKRNGLWIEETTQSGRKSLLAIHQTKDW
jgi:hypothetical protein